MEPRPRNLIAGADVLHAWADAHGVRHDEGRIMPRPPTPHPSGEWEPTWTVHSTALTNVDSRSSSPTANAGSRP